MPAIRGGEISDLGDPIWGTSPKWDKRHIRDTLCTTMQNFTPIGATSPRYLLKTDKSKLSNLWQVKIISMNVCNMTQSDARILCDS